MTTSDVIALTSAVISALSAGASLLGLKLSRDALTKSGEATAVSQDIARRQGVIDLYMAWQGINSIDTSNPANLIGPDLISAANAIGLTATLWNHDVIEKTILFQNYWQPFKDFYDSLYNCTELVPGHRKRCRDLITPDITRAYEDMRRMEIGNVSQTQLGGIKK